MSLDINAPIPDSLLNTEVLDKNGKAVKFSEVLAGECSMVVMVRHFGCIGCTTQMMAIAPKIDEMTSLGIHVKIIGNGDLQYLEGFIEKFKLEDKPVKIYTDPSLQIYKEMELKRTFWHFINPMNVIEFIKALSKGIGQKNVQGDNLQMGGTLLISSSHNLEYYFQNSTIAGIADPNNVMKQVHKYVLKRDSVTV